MSSSSRRDTLTLELANGARVALLYVEEEGVLFVVPSAERTHWASAALQAGSVKVSRPGHAAENRGAYLVTERARVEALKQSFRNKYDVRVWERYFQRRQRILALDRTATGGVRPKDELIREEFDAIAPYYGQKIEADPFEALLRRRSRARLARLFERRDPILELGCGVGVETVPLLRDGHEIVAVDISSAMLAGLRTRAQAAGVAARLSTVQGSLSRLATALEPYPDGYFSGGFSTFGALNLEPDLRQVRVHLARVLKTGAPFLAAVLNHLGLIPKLYEAGIQGPSGFFVRLRGRVPAEGIRYPLDIIQLNPFRWAGEFLPYFSVEGITAVSALTPPFESPRLLGMLSQTSRRRLERWDERLSEGWWGPWLGEWAFVVLRRTQAAVSTGARSPGEE